MVQPPFGDIPLFRELHRLLSSSSGPVNYEIAGQMAQAVAAQSGDRTPSPADARLFHEAVAEAEPVVAGYTRLTPPEPLRVDVLGRAAWASRTLQEWRWMLDRLAGRFSEEISRLTKELAGDTPEELPAAMAQAMQQVGPLLMGMQAGQLVGQLSTEVLTRHHFPIPRDDAGHLIFVVPNIVRVGQDYRFDPGAFARWLAIGEAARHIALVSGDWAERYLRSLLTEVVDTVEIDVAGLQQRLIELQTRGIEALGEEQEALPVVSNPRHAAALGRLRAFVALLEGYGAHVTRAVAHRVLPDSARIDEGMARLRVSPSEGQSMLSSLLGVSFDRTLEASGETFCAAVARLRGLGALNRVWEAPDNLPSEREIKDPFAWMERVLEG